MTTRAQMETWSLTEIVNTMATSAPGDASYTKGQVELLRRETLRQEEVARAVVATARATADNARYMFWSVVGLVATQVVTIIVTVTHFSLPR